MLIACKHFCFTILLTKHESEMQVKGTVGLLSAFFKQQMSNGRIVSVTDLDSLGGHYGVRFNALRWRALWGLNDRSHGSILEC